MYAELDHITFESRREIEELMEVLDEWEKANGDDDKKEFVETLIDMLDVLHMSF